MWAQGQCAQFFDFSVPVTASAGMLMSNQDGSEMWGFKQQLSNF